MTAPRTMLNCAASGRVEFTFRCPMTWDALSPTDDPNRRDCGQCARTVFRVHNAVDAALRAMQGECIAVPEWLASGVREQADEHTGRITIGRSRVGLPDHLILEAVSAHTGQPVANLRMGDGPPWS